MTTRPSDEIDSKIENENPSKKIKLDNEEVKVPAVSQHYSAHNAGITEPDVGIKEYISAGLSGFKGTLKQRYTDFLVNEVEKNGNVVHLTDDGYQKSEPKEEPKEEVKQESTEEATAEKKEPFVLDPENRAKLVAKLDDETVDNMIELLSTGTKLQTTKPIESKDDRTAIHQLVRSAFKSKLETKTTPENTFIITLNNNSNKNNNKRNRFKKILAAAAGPTKAFLHFTVYKENKETMQVAHMLSKFLRIPPKSIQYAGTKDRRGVTVQRASIAKMEIGRLAGMNKTLRGITLGGFKFEDAPLKLGELQGNEFLITIRDVDEKNTENIDKALSSLKENGFINYYGMQRFGTFSVSTHTIGTHILKSDWKTAVELILSPQELVIPESVEARKIWAETKDASKALAAMPRKCVAESSILGVLVKTPNSYLNAIMQVPRNLRMMYGHAYQSYVWNMVASERIKRFGMKPIVGDLVILENEENTTKTAESDQDDFTEDVKQETFIRARPITQEEIDSGAKTIYDVVIPTPGFDILYPENELKQVYIDVMKEDDLDPDNMRRNLREFSLAGSYRHLVAKPGAVEWWIRNYEESDLQMVKTDLDLLKGNLTEEDRIVKEGEGSRTAVILKLQLASSQYATMALREVMKIDTTRRGDGFDVQIKKNEA
jgi:tRNA pseudouridine13 synthase